MLSGLENPLHILILLVVILLVFGAKRLPELGRGLGSGMREFKAGITGQLETTTFQDTTPTQTSVSPETPTSTDSTPRA